MKLADSPKVDFLFNAISSPQLNIAEYFFEYVKRELRLIIYLNKFDILSNLIKRTQSFSKCQFESILKKWAEAIQNCILSKGNTFRYEYSNK